MARRWCSIRNKSKPRGNESGCVTTSSENKILTSSRPQKCPNFRQRFNDASFIHHRCFGFPCRHRCNSEKRIGFAAAEQGRQTKVAFTCARKRDWSALRLFSTVAKESAAIETRTRRSFIKRTRARDRGSGYEPKLR